MRTALMLAVSVGVVGPPDARAEERHGKGSAFERAALARAVQAHLKTVRPVRTDPAVQSQVQGRVARRSWCQRRAAACGALIGFGAGYGLGFALGANPFIDDFVPSADALIVGGIGAAAGGTVGAVFQK